jgi:Velvet factor
MPIPGEPVKQMQNLLGQRTQNSQVFADVSASALHQGSNALFVTFPDLSVRRPGVYRLRFVLVDLQ